jgi:hypothetical protein
MDLRDLITTETSEFAERLTASLTAEVEDAARRAQEEAEATLHQIRAELQQARASLDKARAESEQARGAAEKSRAETEQFRGALTKSRNNEKTLAAAVEKLRADQSTLQAAVDKYRNDDKSRQDTISRLQNSEKSLQASIAKLQSSEKSLQNTIEKLRADQSTLQADLEKARADEKGRQSTIERLQASEKSLQASLDKLQGSEKSTQTTISKLQASEKVYQAKLAQASAASALAEAELKKVQAERDDLAEELQRAETALEQARSAKHQPQKGAAPMPLDPLRNAFQQLAAAGTVTDVLTVLVDALASEFSRVALFNVNGNRLEGRRQTGFDFGSDISKVAVPLTKGSALAEAVRSGRVQGLTANELTDGTRKLFGGSPSFVLILPVPVGSDIHAVIYADNSDQPKAEVSATKRSVHFAEILLWHAIPLIGRLAAEEQALGELREYSTQLLSDLENVYNGDVSAGHKGEKLQRRLQHNVEYARNMFAQRAQDEGLDGVELFDVQLARLITAKQGVAFGKDLAAAARAGHGDQKAEAS